MLPWKMPRLYMLNDWENSWKLIPLLFSASISGTLGKLVIFCPTQDPTVVFGNKCPIFPNDSLIDSPGILTKSEVFFNRENDDDYTCSGGRWLGLDPLSFCVLTNWHYVVMVVLTGGSLMSWMSPSFFPVVSFPIKALVLNSLWPFCSVRWLVKCVWQEERKTFFF